MVVAIAGPNGAGKTTFYRAHVATSGLRLVNADVLAATLHLEAGAAMEMATALRTAMVRSGESFAFETVFSDPVGDKLGFLKAASRAGYTVILCFVGLPGPDVSEERVLMRVSQGGHDVPSGKLYSRFPRTMTNLRQAIRDLPLVFVFDNGNLSSPFRLLAVYEDGRCRERATVLPHWFAQLGE